jgi:hypothetical protein
MFGYHGLIPKLLWPSPGERTMIQSHGITQVELFANIAGGAEIALALWTLLAPRSAWALAVAAMALFGLLLGVAIFNLLQVHVPPSLTATGPRAQDSSMATNVFCR